MVGSVSGGLRGGLLGGWVDGRSPGQSVSLFMDRYVSVVEESVGG